MMTIEATVNCPYCGEEFSSEVDPSVDQQSYIEDCWVCCRPIQFTVACNEGELVSLETEREGA